MLYSEHCSKVCVSQWANFISQWPVHGVSQVVLVVKNLPVSAGDAGDTGLIPESGRLTAWSRKWQPTPVFLPGKFHGQRRLAGYSPGGCKELDTTEWSSRHACTTGAWCYKTTRGKGSIKVQDKPMDFNGTEYKEFTVSFRFYFATTL